MAQAHRSTLKTKHKPFKSRHATKGAIKTRLKGRVEKDEPSSHKQKNPSTKQDRRNTAAQIRLNKINQVTNEKRLFEGKNSIPKIVSVIPLCSDIDPVQVVSALNRAIDAKIISNNEELIMNPGQTIVASDRFNKHKLRYILPKMNFVDMLDAAKVADFTIFVLSATTEVDSTGELCIRAAESQGISSVMGVISGLGEVAPAKKQTEVKQSLQSFFSHFFPTCDKLYSYDNSSDALHVVRTMCQKLPKGIVWRDCRPYVLADNVMYDEESGCAVVEGVVRGERLNPDRLVHVPGCGDFQIDKIVSTVSETLSAGAEADNLDELAQIDADMDEDEDFGDEFDEMVPLNQQSGVRLDGHEYFDNGAEILKGKRVPKGTSAYQASWIVDDVDESDNGYGYSDEEYQDEEELDDGVDVWDEPRNGNNIDMVDDDFISEDHDDTEDAMELPAEEEARQLKEFRSLADEDAKFPDEIELRPDQLVRERMARYRGVKNLRSCFWDANEKDERSPSVWPRLTRIANFRATKNRVLKELHAMDNKSVAEVGSLVRIYIRAGRDIVARFSPECPFTIYGLHKYEHKLSVVNMSITPDGEYEKPIKSKETLIIQCGFRRMVAQPLFSSGSNASNNVYKLDRYLAPGQTSIATVIAPITFGNTPVVYFKESSDGSPVPQLVGTGSVLDTNANRIVVKRAIITGHPVKIHKKLVTIRYMFFNAQDILWYRAVPLFTKSGRSGFIKESLGTHGYFKATFDGKLSSQDTVGMALFKRMWPRTVQVI